MRYEVSYVEHGHEEAANPFGVKLLFGQLDIVPARIIEFRATELPDGKYRVAYQRRWAIETAAGSEMEALRTFLHVSSLPTGLYYRDIVIKPCVEGEKEAPRTAFIAFMEDLKAEDLAIEGDDQRAGDAA